MRNATVQIILKARDLTGTALTGLKAKVGGVTKSLTGMKSAMLGLSAAVGGGALLGFLVKVNAEYGRLMSQLKTFEGLRAPAVFRDLAQFANTTPYELTEVVEAFIALRSAGITPTQEALRLFGDHAAAMGVTIGEFATALRSATTGEFEAMKRMGIVATQQGDKIRVSFQGQTEIIGRNAQAIVSYLEKVSRQNFAGAMEDQAKTLGGAWSTLKDQAAELARAIGDAGLTKWLVGLTRTLTALIGRVTAGDAGIRATVSTVTMLADAVGRFVGGTAQAVLDFFGGWNLLMIDAAIGVQELGLWFSDLGAKIEAGLGRGLHAFGRFQKAIPGMGEAGARNMGIGSALIDKAAAKRLRNDADRDALIIGKAQMIADAMGGAAPKPKGDDLGEGLKKTGGSTASGTNFGGSMGGRERTVAEQLADQVGLEAERLKLRDGAIDRAKRLLELEKEIARLLETTTDPEQRVQLLQARATGREALTEAGMDKPLGPQMAATMPSVLGSPIATPEGAGGIAGTDEVISGWVKVGEAIEAATGSADTFHSSIANGGIGAMVGFGSAVQSAFASVISGSASAGEAFSSSMLGAISEIAAQKGQYYMIESLGALAQGLTGTNPAAFAASAKYAAAGAAMMALAGVLSGSANAASGGGGSRGRSRSERTTRDLGAARGEATLVIEGGLLNVDDPRQEQQLARALEALSGRRVNVRRRG